MSSNWLEISATVARDDAGQAEDALFGAGALSVTFQDAGDAPVLEPAPGETPLWPELDIVGLFEGAADPLATLATVQLHYPAAAWRLGALADRAWEREWLRDFRPLRFGRRLAVVPSEMEAPPGCVIVRLDPGLAFGTGTHPTTALCLEWLDDLAGDGPSVAGPLQDAVVIDYGCGSGILAIAAIKLGAAAAVAVDLDPQALVATRANAALNGVAEAVQACAPEALESVLAGRRAGVLVANILAGPLQSLLPTFAAHLPAGGKVALSGILVGQDAPLAEAATRWFTLDPPATREDWVRISGHRNAAR